MHFGNHFLASVGADDHARHGLAQLRAQPAHQLGAGFAVVQVVIDQHQLRAHTVVEQGRTFIAVSGGPHAAAPARQQALHADQDAVFVVDTQHLCTRHRLAFWLAGHRLWRGLGLCQRYADAEYAAFARP